MKFMFLLTLLALAGCDDHPIERRDATLRMRFIDDSYGANDEVHVVKIDGAEYVIAVAPHGIAICPKTVTSTNR
jgi:hypothetical protein